MLILYPYIESDDPRFRDSRNFINTLSWPGLYKLQCIGPHDYPQFIMKYWGLDDLVIIEHDIVPTIDDLIVFFNAFPKNPLVALRYPLYPSSTGLDHPVCVHRVADDSNAGWHWLRDDEEWADYAGFGLTGFTLESQRALQYPLFPPGQTWNGCDTHISRRFIRKDMRFYVPKGVWVRHDHR